MFNKFKPWLLGALLGVLSLALILSLPALIRHRSHMGLAEPAASVAPQASTQPSSTEQQIVPARDQLAQTNEDVAVFYQPPGTELKDAVDVKKAAFNILDSMMGVRFQDRLTNHGVHLEQYVNEYGRAFGFIIGPLLIPEQVMDPGQPAGRAYHIAFQALPEPVPHLRFLNFDTYITPGALASSLSMEEYEQLDLEAQHKKNEETAAPLMLAVRENAQALAQTMLEQLAERGLDYSLEGITGIGMQQYHSSRDALSDPYFEVVLTVKLKDAEGQAYDAEFVISEDLQPEVKSIYIEDFYTTNYLPAGG